MKSVYKIAILGEKGVGKTTLLSKIKKKNKTLLPIKIKNRYVFFILEEISDVPPFTSKNRDEILKKYDACILMFSVFNEKSYIFVKGVLHSFSLKNSYSRKMPVVVCANKIDIYKSWTITNQQLLSLSPLPIFISSRTGYSCDQVLLSLIKNIKI